MSAHLSPSHTGCALHGALTTTIVSACSQALDALLQGNPALMAVENAISVLEDEPCLNAGLCAIC